MNRRWPAWIGTGLLAGCARTPMDYLQGAAGPAAGPIQSLVVGLLAICVGVVVVIAVLLGLATARARRDQHARGDIVEPGSHGMRWIYWGVGLSLPVLLGMTVWSLLVTRAVATPPARTPLQVEVIGHRWWWEFRYAAAEPGNMFTTANELVIPVGVPVRLRLTSADVIHDFWLPKLGPKMDLIPGQWNGSWLQADRPGTFVGQCAEYCGIEHGRMGLRAVALPPAQFAVWQALARQPAQPAATASGPRARGYAVFQQSCAVCHTVRGTPAGGIVGPDLTHFASRGTLAAGLLPNTPANRWRWLAHTQDLKPGVQMPEVPMSDADRAAVVAWLGQLR